MRWKPTCKRRLRLILSFTIAPFKVDLDTWTWGILDYELDLLRKGNIATLIRSSIWGNFNIS